MRAALLAAVILAFPASAHADTFYGGAAFKDGRQSGPAIGLVAKADGGVAANVSFTYGCGKARIYDVVVQLKGRLKGTTFTAKGKRRLAKPGGLVRFTLTGTVAPDSVTGRLKLRNHCGSPTRSVVLRTAAAPAGAPAVPAPGALFYGLTNAIDHGIRTPVTFRVAKNGRLLALTWASMRCGEVTEPVSNASPSAAIKPDGSFSRNEGFTVRYADGSRDRFKVIFNGRFLADGATGTLRIRVTQHFRHGTAHCDTGPLTWTARG